MTDRISWEVLLASENQLGDGRWAQLVFGKQTEIEREIRDLVTKPPIGSVSIKFVRGERCRNRTDLFVEWSHSLHFPDYFGRNWDAFQECLEELPVRKGEDDFRGDTRADELAEIILVLITRSTELLSDEPESQLETLIEILRSAALGLNCPEEPKPKLAMLRVLFQCKLEEAETLTRRLTHARLDL